MNQKHFGGNGPCRFEWVNGKERCVYCNEKRDSSGGKIMICSHDWKYHQGFLGYQTEICQKCGLDWNDLPLVKAIGAISSVSIGL